VRLYFEYYAHSVSAQTIIGLWRNAGAGSALRVRHGLKAEGFDVKVKTAGGLTEGAALVFPGTLHETYSTREIGAQPWALFCEYQNRMGDHYRVEVPFDDGYELFPDRFMVNIGTPKKPNWLQVSPETK
jgi:hypothetical protein